MKYLDNPGAETKVRRVTDKEALEQIEKTKKEYAKAAKDVAIGSIKGVTTDLPGFLMDVADRLIGNTTSLGENDRSAWLFEKMTGIKSDGGNLSEVVGSLINPVSTAAGIGKAVIVPAMIKSADLAGDAIEASIKGVRGPELWEKFGVFPDPVTGQLKAVIPDTAAAFKPDALKIKEGYQSSSAAENPKRSADLTQSIFEKKNLFSVIDHPELQALLPDLDQTQVRQLILSNALGSFDPTDNTIRLAGGKDPNELLSTALHEIQHAVQNNFSMQGGGNTGMFFENSDTFQAKANKAIDLAREMEGEFDELFKKSPGLEAYTYPATALKMLQDDIAFGGPRAERAQEQLAKIPVKTLAAYNQVAEAKSAARTFTEASSNAYENYRNILGEAEARLVQTQLRTGDYTTYPPKLMAEELGVQVDELVNVLLTDEKLAKMTKVDQTPEIKEAMEFVERLMQSRAASQKPTK